MRQVTDITLVVVSHVGRSAPALSRVPPQLGAAGRGGPSWTSTTQLQDCEEEGLQLLFYPLLLHRRG